jgi:peptidoglycan/xylan/chitin deacetylase (PgdA/CDA1 family)
MRFDRIVTLGLVHTLRRFRMKSSRPVLPILMYHSISDDPEPGFGPYYKVCTSPRRFSEHLQWLADLGCRGVTLSEGLAWLADEPRSSSTSPPPVAITFDDGFRDFATTAFPALQRHGFSATMYLPTAFIGDAPRRFKDRDCMTWADVSELHGAGVEFGSHTVNHPKLVELAWPDIAAELRESKATIEQRLGTLVASFAYPYAFPQGNRTFSMRFCAELAEAGYHTCVTTAIGQVRATTNRLILPRLPANSADDQSLFEAKLRGDYDWMGLPQLLRKKLKG